MTADNPDPVEVGNRLVRLRTVLEMRAGEFAKFLGLSQNRYSQYETGERLPPVTVGVIIASRTGVSLDWLYSGDGNSLPIRMRALVEGVEIGSRAARQ